MQGAYQTLGTPGSCYSAAADPYQSTGPKGQCWAPGRAWRRSGRFAYYLYYRLLDYKSKGQITGMKKIPIWQHKLKTVEWQSEQALTSPLPPAPQLHPIYIDHAYEILATRAPEPEPAIVDFGSDGGVVGSRGASQCSVVHDRRYGGVVWVDFVLWGCVPVGDSYYLFAHDHQGRYQVLRLHSEDFLAQIKDITRVDILENQLNEGQIKPLRKINPCISEQVNAIYLLGNQPLYRWEITSPLWVYHCQPQKWQQIELQSTKQRKQQEEWVILMEGVIVHFGGHYVLVKGIPKHGFTQKQKIMLLSDINSPIINTKTDTYLTCSYKQNQAGPSRLLLLVQTKATYRQPVLLQITITPQFPKLKKPNQENNCDINIEITRYDLGVFLHEESRLEKLEKGSLGNGLWDILNEIVFMQVVEVSTGLSAVHHSMSTTSNSNFIKKKEENQHNFSTQTYKNGSSGTRKVQILTLYTKTKKNYQNTHLIQFDSYQIKLSQLQKIPVGSPNKPLSDYFQKKQYCDLVFFAQKREMHCSRQLFQFYSSKFKKLYSSSSNSRSESGPSPEKQTMVKLDHTKLATIYFLVQHMYYHFSLPSKEFDQGTLIDLMVLSHKFQVLEMQVLCQQEVDITCQNFNRLYDYFRNSETHQFREQFLKYFIIHAQDIIKIMPIGKVEQLIRLVYSPECSHSSLIDLKSKLENTYSIRDSETGQTKQAHKSINYANIIKSQEIVLKICLKCNRLLTFNYETHRKNKSSIRGSSLGEFGHKKKDNKSN